MSKPNIINLNDLLGIDEDEPTENKNQRNDVIEVDLSQLVPFPNHKFKQYKGERLNDMVSSIKEYGILTPIVLRLLDDGTLQILAGHNRVKAAQIAGIEKINKDSFIILEGLTETEARAIVRETNIIQRGFSELSHSEKAAVLTERHEDIKRQGKMKDIINQIENLYKADELDENSNLGKLCPLGESRDKIADKYDISPRMVSYYIRIDRLIEKLKDRLDNGIIPFMAGVNLSFLKEEEQEITEGILQSYGFKVNLKKSEELKTLSQGRNFNHDKAYEVLSGKYFDKPKKSKKPKFSTKFINNIFKKYFNENQSINEVEELIDKLLEEHFSQNRENKDAEEEFEVE